MEKSSAKKHQRETNLPRRYMQTDGESAMKTIASNVKNASNIDLIENNISCQLWSRNHVLTNVLTRVLPDAVLVTEDMSTASFTEETDMKVCNRCGVEIDGIDGDNYCSDCDSDMSSVVVVQHLTDARATREREAREAVLIDLGMAKVTGALGGQYWE